MFIESINCDLLVLLDGSNDIMLEVINPLVESCEIIVNGLRVGSEKREQSVDLISQNASHCFRNISVKASKHVSYVERGVRAPKLGLNFDDRVKDSSYLLLINERLTLKEAIFLQYLCQVCV